jgi:caffeoyl-CoA O-methyltransferase
MRALLKLQYPFKAIMELLPEKIVDYCEKNTKVFDNKILSEIERKTHLNVLSPQMLSGNLQGQFLAMISKMLSPKNILEIGTFTGYSAICLAQGLKEGANLFTIEVNEELQETIKTNISLSNLEDKIKLKIGDATKIVQTLNIQFDLIFIDADKLNYPLYYELCLPKLRKDGIMLIDNMLWSGKVVEFPIKDKKTKAIHELNQRITSDPRVENLLLPIRDGIMWVKKISD